MKWIKKGLIYCPDGSCSWARSHAMVPTPYFAGDDVLRLYVGFRDKNGISRIGFVELDANNPSKVLKVSENPLLDVGAPGTFDDNGVIPSSVVNFNGKLYLYYFSFQLGVKVRYFMFSGLAISEDGGNTFARYSRVPVLDRSNRELFFRSGPFVLLDNGLWKMWYVAGSEWIDINGKISPSYSIKHLESEDGINWGKEGRSCIAPAHDDEYGVGRPFVIKDSGLYKMFYSIRSKSKGYTIGYAESADGLSWTKKDGEVGIDFSDNGWDSQMICYHSIVKHRGITYMFYCGNNFGESGFGYAVLE